MTKYNGIIISQGIQNLFSKISFLKASQMEQEWIEKTRSFVCGISPQLSQHEQGIWNSQHRTAGKFGRYDFVCQKFLPLKYAAKDRSNCVSLLKYPLL